MLLTILLCIFIVGAFLTARAYLFMKEDSEIQANRQWVEQFPALVSTLGVLGTFIGITVGLANFNVSDIDASIPELLSGLQTAFFTSICGMIGSLILSHVVNRKFDKLDKKAKWEMERSEMVLRVVSAIENLRHEVELRTAELKQLHTEELKQLQSADSADKTDPNIDTLVSSVRQASDDIEQINVRLEELTTTLNMMAGQHDRQGVVRLTTAESAAAIENTLSELSEQVKLMAEKLDAIVQNAK